MISKIINSIEENVSGGSAGGGHVIENQSGTDMTQRANLQFIDAQTSDDSTNNRTKVELLKELANVSDLASQPDGLYLVEDSTPMPGISANIVSYSNTTSGLIADDVQEAIDEIVADKVDKVTSATNGDLAGLDANGNLTDSGIASSVINDKQNKILDTPLSIGGSNRTTVETALSSLNNYKTNFNYVKNNSLSTVAWYTFAKINTTDNANAIFEISTIWSHAVPMVLVFRYVQVYGTPKLELISSHVTPQNIFIVDYIRVVNVTEDGVSKYYLQFKYSTSSANPVSVKLYGGTDAKGVTYVDNTLELTAITIDSETRTSITELYITSTDRCALKSELDTKQNSTLSSSMTIIGQTASTVESALSWLNYTNTLDVSGTLACVGLTVFRASFILRGNVGILNMAFHSSTVDADIPKQRISFDLSPLYNYLGLGTPQIIFCATTIANNYAETEVMLPCTVPANSWGGTLYFDTFYDPGTYKSIASAWVFLF